MRGDSTISALAGGICLNQVGNRLIPPIDGSCISSVNVAEVLGRFSRDGRNSRRILKEILATPIEVVSFDTAQALIAAELVPKTSAFGLSLGDQACLALAMSRRIPAMTADQIWTQVNVGVDIRVIR